MTLTPSATDITVGDTVDIVISVDTAGSSVAAAGVEINIDTSVFSLVGEGDLATAVTVPAGSASPFAFSNPPVTFMNGVLTIPAATPGFALESFTGDIAQFTLQADAEATNSQLTFGGQTAFAPALTNTQLNDTMITVQGAPVETPRIFLTPESGSFEVGTPFTVTVNVDTNGESVAAAGIELDIPAEFDLVGDDNLATAVTVPAGSGSPFAFSNPPVTFMNGTLTIPAATPGFALESFEGAIAEFQLSANTEVTGAMLTFGGQTAFAPALTDTQISGATYDATASQNVPPTVAIGSPADGTLQPSTDTDVDVSGTAADTDGTVASVEYQVNGGSFTTATGTTSWSFTATGLAGGANTIGVRSVDDGGANSAVEEITVNVNRVPDVAITSPSDGSSVGENETEVDVSGTVTDADDNVTSLVYSVNGGSPVSLTAGTGAFNFTASGLDFGDNTITVTATDEASETDVATITVERELPAVTYGGADLLVLTEFTDVWYSENEQIGGFQPAQQMRFTGFEHDPSTDWVALAGDLNDDLHLDFVTVTPLGEVWGAVNDLSGGLGPSERFATGWPTDKEFHENQYVMGDFNGDDMADLLAVDSSGNVYTGINNMGEIPSPTLVAVAGLLIGDDIRIKVFDANGDGLDDVFWIDNSTGQIAVVYGNATALASPQILSGDIGFRENPENNEGVVLGDFNGDGNDDVAYITDSNDVEVALMNSAGDSLGTPENWGAIGFNVDPNRGTGWVVLAADADNDGVDDLIQNTGTRDQWVAISNGNDGFEAPARVSGLGFESQNPDGPWMIFAGNATPPTAP